MWWVAPVSECQSDGFASLQSILANTILVQGRGCARMGTRFHGVIVLFTKLTLDRQFPKYIRGRGA